MGLIKSISRMIIMRILWKIPLSIIIVGSAFFAFAMYANAETVLDLVPSNTVVNDNRDLSAGSQSISCSDIDGHTITGITMGARAASSEYGADLQVILTNFASSTRYSNVVTVTNQTWEYKTDLTFDPFVVDCTGTATITFAVTNMTYSNGIRGMVSASEANEYTGGSYNCLVQSVCDYDLVLTGTLYSEPEPDPEPDLTYTYINSTGSNVIASTSCSTVIVSTSTGETLMDCAYYYDNESLNTLPTIAIAMLLLLLVVTTLGTATFLIWIYQLYNR